MEILIEKFVTFAKTLPGLGLVIAGASLVLMYLKGDFTKTSPQETFVTALVCWILYHAASKLDNAYDALYRPGRASGPWGFATLQEARNSAAAALFSPMNPRVTDYAAARRWHYIGERPLKSLYGQCLTIAQSGEEWRKRIQPLVDVSKAARTVFVFALLAALAAAVPSLRAWSGLGAYSSKLGVFSNPWLLLILSLAAFVVYAVLRVAHNVRLYEYVAKNVRHVDFEDDVAAALFEIRIRRPHGAIGGSLPGAG